MLRAVAGADSCLVESAIPMGLLEFGFNAAEPCAGRTHPPAGRTSSFSTATRPGEKGGGRKGERCQGGRQGLWMVFSNPNCATAFDTEGSEPRAGADPFLGGLRFPGAGADCRPLQSAIRKGLGGEKDSPRSGVRRHKSRA